MSKKIKSLPNILTISRIFLTPLCVYFLFSHHYLENEGFSSNALISFLIFIIASLTDAFDGYYARKHNLVSKLGAFLDPLADKIMVVSVFLCFLYMYNDIVNIYILFMIIFRDVFVTLIRMFMQYKGQTMITSGFSKIKTTVQIVAINLMFICVVFNKVDIYSNYLYVLMMFTGILTFSTGLHYFASNYNNLKHMLINEK